MTKWRCIRSYAGEHRAGMGDILDEIPPGVSPTFFEPVESAMMPSPKAKTIGRGNQPVSRIVGIGKKTAGLLGGIGIEKIADLAAADADELAALPGISRQVALTFIEDARRALR